MEYRLIWEAPLHEWSILHTILIIFAVVFLVSACKEEDRKEMKKDIVKGILLICVALFCFFNDFLEIDGTFRDYHDGAECYVAEGEICNYELDSRESFTVDGISFDYERGSISISHFSDMYDDIKENGQYIRITYLLDYNYNPATDEYFPVGDIVKVEIAE